MTTDHLGTPLLATDLTANEIWRGPFEPFGRDINQAAPNSARGQGIFLGFPGQWDDGRWQDASQGADLYYNVHRWYEFGTGRYSRVDPLGLAGGINTYAYVDGNPIRSFDAFGLVGSSADCSCCTEQGTARELSEILEYLKRNQRRYQISLGRIFGSGCGGAADAAQRDIERELSPAYWVTKPQSTRPRSGLNRLSSRLSGATVVVHRVVKLTPCTQSLFFGPDLQADVYFPWRGTSILPPERQVDTILDPICPLF